MSQRRMAALLSAVVVFFGALLISVGAAQASPPKSSSHPSPGGSVRPMSASGCTGPSNDRVCIYVSGSGTYVGYINAQQMELYNWCSTPYVVIYNSNGSIWEQDTGPYTCGTGGSNTTWHDPFGYNAPNNSTACVYWSNAPSIKPCESIYS